MSMTIDMSKRSSRLPPTQDPFYHYDDLATLAKADPGTILRSREVEIHHHVASAYQLLYRTTDVLGNPIATVATVLRPFFPNTSALMSYQLVEDSASMDCAPSYTLDNNQPSLGGALIRPFLDKGYYVVASDYQGPNSAFTCGVTSGNGVLDGIRAALASGSETGIESTAAIQFYGYSGGALASGWAIQLLKSYAPELNVIGAALGGTPVNINATFNEVNSGFFSQLIPAAIMGLAQQYPEMDKYIFSIIKPQYQKMWQDVKTSCVMDLFQFMNKDVAMYFNRSDYLDNDIVTKIIRENEMGHLGAPSVPLYMFHSVHDEVVPLSNAYDMAQSWCEGGTKIHFVSDSLSEHLSLAISGSPEAFNYIAERFDGKPLPQGCQFKSATSTIFEDGVLGALSDMTFNGLKSILHGN
ncbi:LIP-domain-containing protein [Hesseltinella vesiculosa]|uniref:LIP-domain-containing protein n=1 Tax=Hesseltinella vesiculosa TaxID=101127 RepID=A0A1X2G9A5_9FUNG|nr:LIP-domain-containing protein [Hesseltinella vesiculosa]